MPLSVDAIVLLYLTFYYAGAIVVTVPDDPRHFKAPPSEYKKPPPVGFVEGTVVAFAMLVTPVMLGDAAFALRAKSDVRLVILACAIVPVVTLPASIG